MQFTTALTRNLTWPFFDTPEMMCLISLPLALLVALYFRPNFQEPRAAELLLTFGLALVIEGLFRHWYGSSGQPYATPEALIAERTPHPSLRDTLYV